MMNRPLFRLLPMLGLLVMLSGCYLPLRFDAEVEIFRTGHYTAIFDGYITHVPLYEDVLNKEIDSATEKEKAEVILRDLNRNPDVSGTKYMDNGVFKVTWKHKGDIVDEKMHVFIRRNEAFLTFKYLEKEGRVFITGRKLKNKHVDQLAKLGLGGTDGQLRIKTKATVLKHNAHKVVKRKGGGFTYVWNITSFKDSPPSLMFPIQ